ncbi:unnamed protein product [Leptosia nina]|uniref:Uncharacterized protein n=1 Tax=Leptosia nina TaxID=320188 RepID=A0AAV1JMU4_9NEOP
MHPYHTKCDGQTMGQKTCDTPEGYLLGYTCGWSRCDCNAELVFDEKSGYCVTRAYCEQNSFPDKVRRRHGDTDQERRRKKKPSSRIRIPEENEPFVE